MSRLKHPIRAIREPFGTAGLIVACLALVLALTGAAFAAAGLNGKQKKEVKSIAKQFAGKPGAVGPAGPQGAKGDAGAAGSNGKDGASGAPGSTGPTGKTGPTGPTGATGFSGFTETLPSGETETGTWAETGSTVEGFLMLSPISFPIPLAEPSEKVVYLDKSQTTESTTTPIEGCEYEATDPGAVPVAPPGTLCVFTLLEGFGEVTAAGVTTPPAPGNRVLGGFLNIQPESLGTSEEAPTALAELAGTWAVTAK